MKIAIIGAGPAGVTAAYELAKKGYKPEIFEASNRIGGLARSFELWDQVVDLGPHRFFSNDHKVNKLWLETISKDYSIVNRLTRIFYKKTFFMYPLQAVNALLNLGFFESTLCVLSYFKQKVLPIKDDGTFESWVVRRFGYRLFNTFFKTYSEKLWGISCKELDSDFAAQRIKKLSLWEAIKNAISISKTTKHKTLVDQFAYPKMGSGLPYERMVQKVTDLGGKFHAKTPIKKVIVDQSNRACAIEKMDGEILDFDHIISSMPMDHLVKGLSTAPADIKASMAKLKFRNTIVVYLLVEGEGHFPDNWLYIHSADLDTGRITNFRNWCPEINKSSKDSILALEYWCYDQDQIWKDQDEVIIEKAKKELMMTGLINKAKVVKGHVERISKCYPVYATGYKNNLEPVVAYLKTISNLHVIGRYGSFKYNNQDHSILMGLLAAENIAEGKSHNLWQINTDYENYQEESSITEAGLELKNA